jgi:hypothetical protein
MIRLSDNRDASWRSAPRTRLVEVAVSEVRARAQSYGGTSSAARVSYESLRTEPKRIPAYGKRQHVSRPAVMYSAIPIRHYYCVDRSPGAHRISCAQAGCGCFLHNTPLSLYRPRASTVGSQHFSARRCNGTRIGFRLFILVLAVKGTTRDKTR